MRTTLKRGIGRGAAFNGNGRAVLPPGVLTPMRRYRQPPPPGRTLVQWAGMVAAWLLVVVATVAGGLLGGAYLYTHDFLAETSGRTSRDVKIAARRLDLAVPGQPAIAMVVGYDNRPFGPEKDLPARSDTIMLLRADPQTDAISMLSFPRDLLVPIRCPGKLVYTDRINAAYENCGSKGTLETVKALTGLPINYLLTVNFLGFRRIVNDLGGVWIDVDRRYLNTNSGPGPTFAPINLKPGYQRLTGRQALRYVRFRHTDSDLYRVARQQQFVRSAKEQVANHFSVWSIPKIVNAVRDNVEIGVGGGETLDFKTLKNYAFFAYRLPPGHFFQAKIDNLTGYAELTAPQQSIAEAVQTFAHPDVQAPEKAAAAALGGKLRGERIKPSELSLLVLNGTTTPGLAANTSYTFAQRGYRVVLPLNNAPANAPNANYFESKAYFDPAQRNARAAARKIENLLGGADVAPIPPEIRPLANGAMVVAVLGASFHAVAAEPLDRTPKHEPPNVVRNPSAALPLVRKVRRRVPFPLQYPTVLERSSLPDYEVPVRAYTVARRHRAVRLVFRTGASEYWGVQMTDWNDAPVLSEVNEHRRLRGRDYDLYFNGPHLHMVVLRESGVSYWVVNTLLDSLSNETMLAIAKGLRPLRH